MVRTMPVPFGRELDEFAGAGNPARQLERDLATHRAVRFAAVPRGARSPIARSVALECLPARSFRASLLLPVFVGKQPPDRRSSRRLHRNSHLALLAGI